LGGFLSPKGLGGNLGLVLQKKCWRGPFQREFLKNYRGGFENKNPVGDGFFKGGGGKKKKGAFRGWFLAPQKGRVF